MYTERIVTEATYRAEQARQSAEMARLRKAVKAETMSARRRPAWTMLRRRCGEALVALGERLRGTTTPVTLPGKPSET